MKSKSWSHGVLLVVVFSAVLLGGCATTQFSGFSEDPMATLAIVQNPDVNGGVLSPEAFKTIQRFATSCQQQVSGQLAGATQSAVNGALPYGIAGAGAGPAASAAFAGAKASEYALYGGIAYVLPGAVNGLVGGSYSVASAKGECTRAFWEDVVHKRPEFAGAHVLTVYAGKKWGDSSPPALEKEKSAKTSSIEALQKAAAPAKECLTGPDGQKWCRQ